MSFAIAPLNTVFLFLRLLEILIVKTDGTILITTVIAFIMKVCIIIRNQNQRKTSKFSRKVSNLDSSTNEVHKFWRIPGRNKNIG